MQNYGIVNIEDESEYLSDKHKYYRLGWQDCKYDRPMRKFTLHNKEDAAEKEMYLIGYSDYIANQDWQHDYQ